MFSNFQKERKLLRLLESTLAVCNYVDYVDNPVFASTSATETALPPNLASRRLQTQLRLICSILTGLVVSNDYAAGQELIKDKDFAKYEAFFQTVFEIGRRYKVLNPGMIKKSLIYYLFVHFFILFEKRQNEDSICKIVVSSSRLYESRNQGTSFLLFSFICHSPFPFSF